MFLFLYQCWICFIKKYPVSLFPGYEVGYHGFTETVFIVPQPVVLHGRIRGHKELVMHVLQLPIIHPADQANVDWLCYLLTKCYYSLALNLTYHWDGSFIYPGSLQLTCKYSSIWKICCGKFLELSSQFDIIKKNTCLVIWNTSNIHGCVHQHKSKLSVLLMVMSSLHIHM